MKIGRLMQQADEAAARARSDRLEYKAHADRALVIARRRVGSTAGLAISFSLGFMAGTGTASARDGRKYEDDDVQQRRGPPLVHQLARGPVGEAAMKLGMALLARSLMKLQQDSLAAPPPVAHPADIAGES